MSCQQSQEAEDEKWNLTECTEGMRRCKRGGELNYNNGEEEMDWSGQEENWRDQRFSTGTMKGGKKVSNPATHSFPSILLQFCRLCPLSSFTFTLHPARVDLVASDEWRGSDAVYRIGLRGLGVSAVCKVASAVWYNMAGLLATKLVAAAALPPYYDLWGCIFPIIRSTTGRNHCQYVMMYLNHIFVVLIWLVFHMLCLKIQTYWEGVEARAGFYFAG